MSITEEIQEIINFYVWSGLYTQEEIEEIILKTVREEYLYFPEPGDGEINETEIRRIIATEYQKKKSEELTWRTETDCDRLDRVFEELNAQGILAIQNAGYTQSDGLDCVIELYHEPGGTQSSIVGYCFYHQQDLERVVGGRGLHLTFGAIDGDHDRGIEVGHKIQQTLTQAGFRAGWNGELQTRIAVNDLKWQKRFP